MIPIRPRNGTFYDGTAAVNNDDLGRLTARELDLPDWTAIDQLGYGYNEGSQRTQQVFTAGNYVNYTYDPIGQLESARGYESGGGARLHEQFGYGYDAAWNLAQRTNHALVQTFGVNAVNELTTVSRAGTLTVAGTTTSAATNVTVNAQAATLYGDATFAREGFSLADGNNTFTAIAKDSYGRQDTNVATAWLPVSASYVYDLNGNLLSDGRRGFDYDDENQLVRVTVTNAWKSEFGYDGFMRRRTRREYTWLGGAWVQTNEVRYVYDRKLVLQERDANNVGRVVYTRGRDLSGSLEEAGGIGGLLARTDQSTLNPQLSTAYYHSDANGNVVCLINRSNAVVARYQYDPYGNILSQSGPLAEANLYRFSSKEAHPNSGLVYYLYRYYEPGLQRWVNRDPLGEAGGYNLYQFSVNNPKGFYDPFGLQPRSPPVRPPTSLFDIPEEGSVFGRGETIRLPDRPRVGPQRGGANDVFTPSPIRITADPDRTSLQALARLYHQMLEIQHERDHWGLHAGGGVYPFGDLVWVSYTPKPKPVPIVVIHGRPPEYQPPPYVISVNAPPAQAFCQFPKR